MSVAWIGAALTWPATEPVDWAAAWRRALLPDEATLRVAIGAVGEEPLHDGDTEWLGATASGLAHAVVRCRELAEGCDPHVTHLDVDGWKAIVAGCIEGHGASDPQPLICAIDSGVLAGDAGYWATDADLPPGWHAHLCASAETELGLSPGAVRHQDDLRGFEPIFAPVAGHLAEETPHLVLRIAEDHEQRVEALPDDAVDADELAWLRGGRGRADISQAFRIGEARVLAMDSEPRLPAGNTALFHRLRERGVLDALGCTAVAAHAYARDERSSGDGHRRRTMVGRERAVHYLDEDGNLVIEEHFTPPPSEPARPIQGEPGTGAAKRRAKQAERRRDP